MSDNLSGNHHQGQAVVISRMYQVRFAYNLNLVITSAQIVETSVTSVYRQQSFSGLPSPGQSDCTITCYPRIRANSRKSRWNTFGEQVAERLIRFVNFSTVVKIFRPVAEFCRLIKSPLSFEYVP